MEIGTELFAMAATCAYAQSLPSAPSGKGDPEQLADLFCRQTRRRIEGHFRAARRSHRGSASSLAGQVLDGAFEWLEQGIIDARTDG